MPKKTERGEVDNERYSSTTDLTVKPEFGEVEMVVKVPKQEPSYTTQRSVSVDRKTIVPRVPTDLSVTPERYDVALSTTQISREI